MSLFQKLNQPEVGPKTAAVVPPNAPVPTSFPSGITTGRDGQPLPMLSTVPATRRLVYRDMSDPTAPPPQVIDLSEAPAPQPPTEQAKEKKPRGRPRKGVIPLMTIPPVTTPVTTPVASVAVKEVTISYGMTINLGDYQSARVDVSMKTCGADIEALRARVLAELEKACEPFADKKVKK